MPEQTPPQQPRDYGLEFVAIACWLWLTLSVGPWYVGVGILGIGTAINYVLRERR